MEDSFYLVVDQLRRLELSQDSTREPPAGANSENWQVAVINTMSFTMAKCLWLLVETIQIWKVKSVLYPDLQWLVPNKHRLWPAICWPLLLSWYLKTFALKYVQISNCSKSKALQYILPGIICLSVTSDQSFRKTKGLISEPNYRDPAWLFYRKMTKWP